MSEQSVKKPRGFLALSPERRREIASQGGKAAHASGNAHQFTSQEARVAGRLGQSARRRKKMEGRGEVMVIRGTQPHLNTRQLIANAEILYYDMRRVDRIDRNGKDDGWLLSSGPHMIGMVSDQEPMLNTVPDKHLLVRSPPVQTLHLLSIFESYTEGGLNVQERQLGPNEMDHLMKANDARTLLKTRT